MRHYKIVKSSTMLTIALCALGMILQLGLIFLPESSPVPARQASAEDAGSCGSNQPPNVSSSYDGNNIIIQITPFMPDDSYDYTIHVYSNGNLIDFKEGSISFGNQSDFPYEKISLPVGSYNSTLVVDIVFTYVSITPEPNPCKFSYQTTLEPLAPDTESGRVMLVVTPVNLNLIENPNGFFEIDYRFNQAGDTYELAITDCSGKQWTKFSKSSGIGILQGTYQWTPEEKTSCNHTITLYGLEGVSIDGVPNIKFSKEQAVSVIGGGTTGTPNEDAGTLDPGTVQIPTRTYRIGNYDVKIATIDYGLPSIFNLILNLIQYLLGILAFVGLVYGGILYITANGDETKSGKAKKAILYSIYGIVLAVLAGSIVLAIKSLF